MSGTCKCTRRPHRVGFDPRLQNPFSSSPLTRSPIGASIWGLGVIRVVLFVPSLITFRLGFFIGSVRCTLWPRNFALDLVAWVTNVFSTFSSSALSSFSHLPISARISSQSSLLPMTPIRKSSAYRTYRALLKSESLPINRGILRSVGALPLHVILVYIGCCFLFMPRVHFGMITSSTNRSKPSM